MNYAGFKQAQGRIDYGRRRRRDKGSRYTWQSNPAGNNRSEIHTRSSQGSVRIHSPEKRSKCREVFAVYPPNNNTSMLKKFRSLGALGQREGCVLRKMCFSWEEGLACARKICTDYFISYKSTRNIAGHKINHLPRFKLFACRQTGYNAYVFAKIIF